MRFFGVGVLVLTTFGCAVEASEEGEADTEGAALASAPLPGLPAGDYFRVGGPLEPGSLFSLRLFARPDARGNTCAVSSIVALGTTAHPRTRLYTATTGVRDRGVFRIDPESSGDYVRPEVESIWEPDVLGKCRTTGPDKFEITAAFEEDGPTRTFSIRYSVASNGTVTFQPIDGELPVSWSEEGTILARGTVHECANPYNEATCAAQRKTCVEGAKTKRNGSWVYPRTCR